VSPAASHDCLLNPQVSFRKPKALTPALSAIGRKHDTPSHSSNMTKKQSSRVREPMLLAVIAASL